MTEGSDSVYNLTNVMVIKSYFLVQENIRFLIYCSQPQFNSCVDHLFKLRVVTSSVYLTGNFLRRFLSCFGGLNVAILY